MPGSSHATVVNTEAVDFGPGLSESIMFGQHNK